MEENFPVVQAGLQGRSWSWILDGGEKFAIDTFASMTHQVKSPKDGAHVRRVIEAPQQPEGHENGTAG